MYQQYVKHKNYSIVFQKSGEVDHKISDGLL